MKDDKEEQSFSLSLNCELTLRLIALGKFIKVQKVRGHSAKTNYIVFK